MTTHLTNGQGAADGHKVSLAVIVGGRAYNHVGTVKGGKAVIRLNLPASERGKNAVLKASSSSSSVIYTGATADKAVKIVK